MARRATELNPTAQAFDLLAWLYLNHGMYEEAEKAIVTYEKAIENTLCLKSAHNELGALYAKVRKYDEAIKEFESSARIDSRYAIGYK